MDRYYDDYTALHIDRQHFFKFQASSEAEARAMSSNNGVLGSARWRVSISKTVVHGSPARPTLAKLTWSTRSHESAHDWLLIGQQSTAIILFESMKKEIPPTAPDVRYPRTPSELGSCSTKWPNASSKSIRVEFN